MSRLLVGLFTLALTAFAAPADSAPSDRVSRYERDVHDAQKRLHKHRIEKAKKMLRRQRAKAKQLYKQQHSQQRPTGT
jgi:Spy/CpxP family protein refolding chaperone